MDDSDEDTRYSPNPYASNYHHQSYVSSHRQKLPVRNPSYAQSTGNEFREEEEEDDDNDDDNDEEEEEEEEENVVQRSLEEADEDDREGDDGGGDKYSRRMEAGEDSERHRKRRKLRNSAMAYEFAPRTATPSVVAAADAPKAPLFGGRIAPTEWTEHSTFVLLDAWGDRFLQLGRKTLRSEDWHEVAKRVSQASKIVRTEAQCRNRLDTLKKKYRREKVKLEETGGNNSKWVYFKKMDLLMSPSPRQHGLPCGVDSGEYVFMNPNVYLNRVNGVDEMRDSPGNSESSEGEKDHSDGLPPKKGRLGESRNEKSSFRLLADSIQKFGEIYEKIENNKRQQMLELEKIRMEFHRDLELQKKQILEQAQAEIAKIQEHDDDDSDDEDDEIDVSVENISE